MSWSKSVNIQNIPEDIGRDLDYFVDLYKTTKKQYVLDAIKNYNLLQRQVEEFKSENPGKRFRLKLVMSTIQEADEEIQKAAVLVY